jgi:drug/metabolite transporter (DMT)-like permease
MSTYTRSILGAVIACLIWAGSFVIARGVHENIPPITLAFWRWVVALIAMFAISYKSLFSEISQIKKNFFYIFLMGAVGVGAFNSLVYIAAHYTTAHHIALISSLSPIGTLLIAGAIGFEKFTKNKFLGAISAFIGAVTVISRGDVFNLFQENWNKGDILLIISATIWAGWGAMLHYKPKEITSKVFLTVQIIVGVIILFPFYIWEFLNVKATPFDFNSLIVYVYLGVGSSCIAWLLWQFAVKNVGAVKTSLVYYTLPIFTSLLAVITLGEPIKIYHLVGFALIFFGIVISNLKENLQKNNS